jgi:hypothetical protein
MNIEYRDSPAGPYDERDHGIDLWIGHTTEGHYAGDIASLTQGKSVHKYVPKQKRLVHRMVPIVKRAWHAGWGKWGGAAGPGPWTAEWNGRSVGMETEHVQGEAWAAEHLARIWFEARNDVQANHIPRMIRHMDIAAGRPPKYGGSRSDPTDFPFWDDFSKTCYRAPYKVLGGPDVPVDAYVAKLHTIMDDATARAAYAEVVRRGFAPGHILAIIGAESTYGTDGIAVRTRNWGNVRKEMVAARVEGSLDMWPVFKTWRDSLDDVLDRLEKKDDYLPSGNDELVTTRVVWAPVGDGTNNPFGSALKMLDLIIQYKGMGPSPEDYQLPNGTYPVSSIFLESWTASGGVWKPNQLTPGFALTPKFYLDQLLHQRFERGVARKNQDGTISWLLLSDVKLKGLV